jgi:hypothetical protein
VDFQSGTTLGTAANSSVDLIDGAQAGNVFWEVGSSATLGTGTMFAGSILALDSITADTGATITGALDALNGAVTLDANTISVVPEPGSSLLLGSGLLAIFGFRRRVR